MFIFKYKFWTSLEAFSFFAVTTLVTVNVANYISDKWEFPQVLNVIGICAVYYAYSLSKIGSDEEVKQERKKLNN